MSDDKYNKYLFVNNLNDDDTIIFTLERKYYNTGVKMFSVEPLPFINSSVLGHGFKQQLFDDEKYKVQKELLNSIFDIQILFDDTRDGRYLVMYIDADSKLWHKYGDVILSVDENLLTIVIKDCKLFISDINSMLLKYAEWVELNNRDFRASSMFVCGMGISLYRYTERYANILKEAENSKRLIEDEDIDKVRVLIYDLFSKRNKYILNLSLYNWFDDDNSLVYEIDVKLIDGYRLQFQAFPGGRYFNLKDSLIFIYYDSSILSSYSEDGYRRKKYFISLFKCFDEDMFKKFMKEFDESLRVAVYNTEFKLASRGYYKANDAIIKALKVGTYRHHDYFCSNNDEAVIVKDGFVFYENMKDPWWGF